MMGKHKTTIVASVLLVVLFVGSVFALRRVQQARGKEATLEDVLYISSSKTLKRMSLGYYGLLADIYWTRVVQYFGSRVLKADHFDLVAPLLDITTDLDPHLIPAYQTGSIFLCQQVPYGAGQPDKAVALLERGIRENPTYWRMYYTLGFVHYMDRKDYKAAKEAFETGAKIPGALPWMKVMAARMAEHQDINTAIALWQGVHDMAQEDQVRRSSEEHIASLQADAEMEELGHRVQSYREQKGVYPAQWSDLIHAGLLRGVPVDPHGDPFRLLPGGEIQVQDPKQFMFLGEGRQ